MPRWARDIPWRQGHVLTRGAVQNMDLTHPESPSAIVVIVSHDCDILQSPDIEPNVEVLYGRPIEISDGNNTHAKNPRKLHLPFTTAGRELLVELLATEKFALPKEALVNFEPTPDVSLPWEQLSILQRWLAARYRRAAFPDAFDKRLDTTGMKDKLSKILTPLGEHIHAVFFDVDDGEEIKREAPEDTYTLDIYLLYNTGHDPKIAGDAVTKACKNIVDTFRTKLFIDGRGWQHIELRDCVPMSDNAMTYRQSILFKKWNIDYVSLRHPSQPEPFE